MLEKNKDYIEMRVSSTDFAFVQNKPVQLCVEGSVDATNGRVPGPGEDCIIVSKEKFEQLQTENEQLKKKLQVPDPFAEYKELLEKLHSKEDVEKFEWTLNHICGGQASVNGWMVTAKLWRRNYETLSKLIGFSSVEEIEDYLVNEAECDTLHEAILKLKDQVKYTCDEWYSANSRNNSWKAAAECNTPKELIEKLNLLRDDISGHDTVIKSYERNIKKWQKATGCLRPEEISAASIIAKAERLDREVDIYTKTLQEWKEGTGCPSPSAAKSIIESAMSWNHAYNEVVEKNRKLTGEVELWKHVTGYATPEDYPRSRLNSPTPFDYTAAWQTVTGCDSPQEAGVKINNLCDEICKLKGDYDRLLKLTGYKSEDDICMTLNHSEQFVYETLMELVNSLKRKAKFTDSNWETATGFSTPEKCCSYIDRLEKKLEDIKNLTEED